MKKIAVVTIDEKLYRNAFISNPFSPLPSRYYFCIVEGVPREENLPRGVYIGTVKRYTADKKKNEIPIIDKYFQLLQKETVENLEDLLELAVSLYELPKRYAKEFVEIARNMHISTPNPIFKEQWQVRRVELVVSLLYLDDDKELPFEISKDDINNLPQEIFTALEINKEKIKEKLEKLEKERRGGGDEIYRNR